MIAAGAISTSRSYANLLRMYDYLGIPLHSIRLIFIFAQTLSICRLDHQMRVNQRMLAASQEATSFTYRIFTKYYLQNHCSKVI